MWQKAKRAVNPETAKLIVQNAHKNGAKVVGVFVSEEAQTMMNLAREVGLDYIQLHGDKSRASLPDISGDFKVIYVTSFDGEGVCRTPIPDLDLVSKSRGSQSAVDFFLADGLQGGSGVSFDWRQFQVPDSTKSYPWILAGGLNPTNVSEAARLVKPYAVDVSSGVCGPDGLKKDPIKVSSFIEQIRLLSLGNA
nr:phosphoribosylanthranilate isomerase (PAI4) [Polytomella parva]|eukprot:CAMPEP_0175055426 /NCGR_PEP_ID=MMETSP0052_2-20121109/10072_1 /TAXON_ID=51329 ORGANISM="Polytomella parva, Strain SAG 63-3" /NCGR_SAMPLE_ID=MMETSP0052_2 /ASSEMBLY_ACC=CAM_ASM_000194 /LENGTH=193 /DNA_ID=CAMNT_0016320267 /DNA_START=627 /DNA_END=1208 /DNA_ORIENTATION=-